MSTWKSRALVDLEALAYAVFLAMLAVGIGAIFNADAESLLLGMAVFAACQANVRASKASSSIQKGGDE